MRTITIRSVAGDCADRLSFGQFDRLRRRFRRMEAIMDASIVETAVTRHPLPIFARPSITSRFNAAPPAAS